MKYFLLLLLIQSSILINSTIAQTKIMSIKARIISDDPAENNDGFYPINNQIGAFSDNIIDNPEFPLFNTFTDQLLVSVELIESKNQGHELTFRFSAVQEGKTLLKKERMMYPNGDANRRNFYFILDDIGCRYLTFKAELIKKKKVISTMTKKIEFECGE